MTSHVRPPSVAGLKASDLRLWNALASFCGAPIALAGGASVTIEPSTEPAAGTALMAIAGETGPRFIGQLVAYPFREQFGADLEAADLDILPDTLREALATGIAGLFSRLLLGHRFGEMQVSTIGALPDLVTEAEREALAWWSVAVTGLGSEPARIVVGCGRAELVRLAERDMLAPRPNWMALRRVLTVDGYTTLGRLTLPLASLRALTSASLIVLPKADPADVMVRFARALYTLADADGGLRCMQIVPIDDPAARDDGKGLGAVEMTKDLDHAGAEGIATMLDVTLDLDLGRVTVPIAELESWAPGAIVPLERPVREPGIEVTIRANGKAIGVGDLVEIDDRLAIRLTRLSLGG